MTTSRAGDVEVLRVATLGSGHVDAIVRHLSMAFAEASRAVVLALPDDAGTDAEGSQAARTQAALSVQEAAAALACDWEAVPILFACPSEPMRRQLQAHASSRHVAVTSTLPEALTVVLGSTPPTTASRDLSPHPTSPRAARDLVSRALLDWHLLDRLPAAALVTSELVTNAMLHARTRISLRVAAHGRAVRISVDDGVPELVSVSRPPRPTPERREAGDRAGRGLAVVAALSKRWGVLPTATGGKSVWALMDDVRTGTPGGH